MWDQYVDCEIATSGSTTSAGKPLEINLSTIRKGFKSHAVLVMHALGQSALTLESRLNFRARPQLLSSRRPEQVGSLELVYRSRQKLLKS